MTENRFIIDMVKGLGLHGVDGCVKAQVFGEQPW